MGNGQPPRGWVLAASLAGTLLLVVGVSVLAGQGAVSRCGPQPLSRPAVVSKHVDTLTTAQPAAAATAASAAAAAAGASAGVAAAVGAVAAAAGSAARIPKIFHRIYIADASDPKRANYTMPLAHQRWIESCQQHYNPRSGWAYRFWDAAAAEALLEQHYPWFLDFYRQNATKSIEKSDLIRHAIMHRFGGLYVDSDIECWREGGDLLEGWDMVLQATHAAEGVTNAAMAARPGLEVFVKALQLVQTRNVTQRSWLQSAAIVAVKQVIERTGPELLGSALEAVGVRRTPAKMFGKLYVVDGVVYRMYRVGAWFTPCQWWEVDCRRRVYRQRAGGQQDMRNLVGFHRYVGSWIQGKEDGKGILNATAELCGVGSGWPGQRQQQQQQQRQGQANQVGLGGGRRQLHRAH